MTVKELIDVLKTKEQDKEIFIDSGEAGHLERIIDGTDDYCGASGIVLSI